MEKHETKGKNRTEATLQETHDRLINTLESMTDGFVSLDKNWHYIYVNRRAAEMFGRNALDLIGKHIWTEFPEGVGQPFYHNYYKAVKEQVPITMEEYYPPWKRWFENRIYPTPDGLSIFFQEITARKMAEELINGQRQLHEMIATGRPLDEILTALVLFIESQAPGLTCSILLLDEDGLHVRHSTAPGLPREFVEAVDGSPIGPEAGSCGTAAFRGEAVFVEDIETDPLWKDYKHLALPHGLRACSSTPIFDEQRRVLGTFAIYYKNPVLPEASHLHLIEIATHIASISIGRHRAEEILRQSEERLALIYETVNDIIFLVDVESDERFRFISVNQAFLVATGLRIEEVIGKSVEQVIPPSAHQLVFENYKKAIRKKRPVQWEEVSEFPAGKKTAIVKISPVFDDQGVCTNLVGVVHDVTEFREAEEEVRKSQEELEHIYKTAPVGLALVDEDLRFVRINEELAAINGKPAEEHIGKTIREVVPEVTPEIEAVYRKVLSTGRPVRNVEVHGTTPAQPGHERDWLANYYPVKSIDGKVRGVNVVVLEITDRAATAALGEMAIADTDLEALFRAAQEIISRTLNTPFITVNELQPDRESLHPRVSHGWTEEVPYLNVGKESQAGFTLLTGEPVTSQDLRKEKRFDVPTELFRQGIVSSVTVVIPGKLRPYGVLGAYSVSRREFTPTEMHFLETAANILGTVIERKKLEEQIFQAQKLELIGGLAAGVAHQLNTPLAVITMRLQMLKEDIAATAGDSSLSQLEIIQTSAKKMSSIIQDLLNFSRVSKLQKEKVKLETLLNQILSFVEVRASKQKVELRQDSSQNIPELNADRNRLEQAFLNIIVNALDSMPDGGVLTVTTGQTKKMDREYLVIEFRDTGSGMSADETSKIFDPFFTTKPVGRGTGLGLSVSYEIIRSHGGKISVSSKKGQGSTFQVLLPLAQVIA